MSCTAAMIGDLYTYLTDFIINLANLMGLSYYEVNWFLFCLGFPIVTLVLLGIIAWQKRQLRRLEV